VHHDGPRRLPPRHPRDPGRAVDPPHEPLQKQSDRSRTTAHQATLLPHARFGELRSAARFCAGFEEQRQYFRPVARSGERVSLAERRHQFQARWAAVIGRSYRRLTREGEIHAAPNFASASRWPSSDTIASTTCNIVVGQRFPRSLSPQYTPVLASLAIPFATLSARQASPSGGMAAPRCS
jgi:hypothetical protein